MSSTKPITTFWRIAGMSYLQVRDRFLVKKGPWSSFATRCRCKRLYCLSVYPFLQFYPI